MAMQGNLHDMSVADLIQQSCQDRKTAQLIIRHNGDQAAVYFKDGQVAHAVLGSQAGEEVVYHILGWEEGAFELSKDVEPPSISIQRSWTGLLMEGAKRVDESRAAAEAAQTQIKIQQPEVNHMASQLEVVLKSLGSEVNGYLASAVVGTDGISIAHDLQTNRTDIDSVGAQTALLIKLVDTSTAKMAAGALEDNLLTTENALVLIRYLENKKYFLTIVADKRGSSLGNLRLMSRIYSERVAKAIPR